MNTITILPCPFCGYDDVEIDEIGPENFAVICPECGCIGPNMPTIMEAISYWNDRRGSDDKYSDQIADPIRVVDWALSPNRKPPETVFTSGPERQAAYWIRWAEARLGVSLAGHD